MVSGPSDILVGSYEDERSQIARSVAGEVIDDELQRNARGVCGADDCIDIGLVRTERYQGEVAPELFKDIVSRAQTTRSEMMSWSCTEAVLAVDSNVI